MFTDKNKAVVLDYAIHSYSSTSPTFTPSNVLVDDPTNANSRWTTTSNDAHQYIILKLKNDSIVTSVTFGKFHKLHVCNVKTMSISSYTENENEGSISEEGFIEDGMESDFSWSNYPSTNTESSPLCIFKGGLRNDSAPEKFPMKYLHKNTFVMSRYIKIKPLQAWGVNFNFSFWFIQIHGIERKDIVLRCIEHNYLYLTGECYKMILKYLKEQNKYKTLKALQEESGMNHEPEIKDKMRVLLESGNFEELEKLMCEAVDMGIVDREYYLKGNWVKLEEFGPEKRGGHAMSIVGSKIYIQGGWNGKEEIGDMWIFDCNTEKWKLVSKVNEKRSCHKMIFLPGRNGSPPSLNNIFYTENDSLMFIGKFAQRDNNERRMSISLFDLSKERMDNFKYKWEVENIFDHQSVLIEGKLYIFGGKVFINDQISFGGLYVLENSEFKRITHEYKELIDMRGRIGHSLIYFENEHYNDIEKMLNSKNRIIDNINKELMAKRNLLVIGGVRDKQSYRNITFIDLDSDTIYKTVDFPIETENKIVHRSVLIEDKIYFLFCYENNKNNHIDRLAFYIYHIYNDKWTHIKTNEDIPVPRSAHTFGYNEELKRFYLFGGNVGTDSSQKRLDDLWKLDISAINDDSLKVKIRFDVRKHKFLRLVNEDLEAALDYLQMDIFDVVDHKCSHDERKFKKLCVEIYKKKKLMTTEEVIDDLSKYFVNEMKPLKSNLYRCIL